VLEDIAAKAIDGIRGINDYPAIEEALGDDTQVTFSRIFGVEVQEHGARYNVNNSRML
jgi:hypothetical protein